MRGTPHHGSSLEAGGAGSFSRVVGLFNDFPKGVK
jgi:hypothetical protein